MKLPSTYSKRIAIAAASVARLLVIGVSSFGLATAANWQNHRGYWHGTIVRVQTTDFNMLSHMLPTKLSYMLMQGNINELQRVLDSNYGLFGIVVTDCSIAAVGCPGQQIRYATNSELRWRQELETEQLLRHPYDLLRDPPPLLTEGGFDSARDEMWNASGRTNPGRIIGRVYYVRGVPPQFWDAYSAWLQKLPGGLLSDRGSERYYALTLSLFSIGGAASWGFIEWIFQRKRFQQQLSQQAQALLLRDAQNLQDQLKTQLQRQNLLLKELERYRQQQTRLIQTSKQTIGQYKERLAQKVSEQRNNSGKLTRLQQQLQQTRERQVKGQTELEHRNQEIVRLQTQISAQQAENNRADESLKQLQCDLNLTQQQVSSASNRLQELDGSIASLTAERNSAIDKTRRLEQELKIAQAQTARFEKLTQDLESTVVELNQYRIREQKYEEYQKLANQKKEELDCHIQSLNDQINSLSKENGELRKKRLPQQINETVLLSELSLALVGGRCSVRREVREELHKNYGLQLNKFVEIPPTSEKTINQNILAEKIYRCKLVVVVTSYIGHDLTNMISLLKASKTLSGSVLYLKEHGKTGIVREIIAYVQKNAHRLHGC